jgi:hypothetical protein
VMGTSPRLIPKQPSEQGFFIDVIRLIAHCSPEGALRPNRSGPCVVPRRRERDSLPTACPTALGSVLDGSFSTDLTKLSNKNREHQSGGS